MSKAPDTDEASLANERFGFTLFVSICAHVVLILGVGYSVLENLDPQLTMDITLAQYRSEETPEEADFFAQENQLGSGSLDELASPSTPIQSPFNDEKIMDVSSFIPEEAKPPVVQESILTVDTLAPDQLKQIEELEENQLNEEKPLPAETNTESLDQTLASLQAQLDIRRQEYARRPRKHTISSASTKQSRDALYLDTWRKQIESVGNLNYPQQASQEKIYGSLRLLVALRPDGVVEEIRILSSSGHAVLDNAAIRIVQLAAPFAPFSEEMKRDVDILEIIRTWQFHNSDSFRSY